MLTATAWFSYLWLPFFFVVIRAVRTETVSQGGNATECHMNAGITELCFC